MTQIPRYVVITPARNEAQFIELTLSSMVAQTVTPLRWVIVNDGSTDGTEEIVRKYAKAKPWIQLLSAPARAERHFAGKVAAFNLGYAAVKDLNPEIIGNLDADVSFEADYFEFLMTRFSENPKLGCAGTAFSEEGMRYNYEFVGIDHVSGMCQMFRRDCFEEIGGYIGIKSGGIDLIAVLNARAKGWETRTFLERTFEHHRIQGGALNAGIKERVYTGRKDYLLGNHPLWELFRSIYQMSRKPYVIGGALVFGSYVWNLIRRVERTMPKELMVVRRHDQIERLKLVIKNRLPEWNSTTSGA